MGGGEAICKGNPWKYISAIQQGNTGKQLRPKVDGKLGNKMIDNRGVSRESLPSAQLVSIYFDAVIEEYEKSIPEHIRDSQTETIERHELEERKWTTHLWRNRQVN